MLSKEEILDRICEILVKEFEVEPSKARAESHLIDDLDLDSIDAIDLAVQLEEQYDQSLEEEELKALSTVDDVVSLIHAKLSGAGH